MLDHYYATGTPLHGDVVALYRICRAFDDVERKAVDSVLSQFFDLLADGYHNSRADAELKKQAEHHERLSNAGRKRWQKPGSSQAYSQAIANPQPHPQPHKEKTKTFPPAKPAGDTQEFLAFWNAYPKKLSRQEALKSWHKAECGGRLGEVLASLTAWKKTEQWNDPQYIPYPATWLNKGLWKESPRPVTLTNGPSLMDERRRLEAKFEPGRR